MILNVWQLLVIKILNANYLKDYFILNDDEKQKS